MELNKQKFSLAAASTIGIVYVVCAVLSIISPELVIKLFGWLMHAINLDKIADGAALTPGGLLLGLIQSLVYSYLVAWVFASLYNSFLKKPSPKT